METVCDVYWGHSGCGLPQGHDADRALPLHRQADHLPAVTAEDACLFGDDLTEHERAVIADTWA